MYILFISRSFNTIFNHQANISNDGNDPPLVSDIKQYKITVNAIRTDPVTVQSIGDSAHLPPCYQKQSVAIGPDYMTDFLTFSQRKGWKSLFTHDQRRYVPYNVQKTFSSYIKCIDLIFAYSTVGTRMHEKQLMADIVN